MPSPAEALTPALLRAWPLPEPAGSKYGRGQVVVVGGARSSPGAAILAGLSSLRVGAGRLQAIADVLKVPVETFFAGQPGSGDGEAPTPTFFEDPKVMELVMAFQSISDETTRDSVLSIVKVAASLRQGLGKD